MQNNELLNAPQIENIEIVKMISTTGAYHYFEGIQKSLDRSIVIKTPINAAGSVDLNQTFAVYYKLHHDQIQRTLSHGLCRDGTPFVLLENVPGQDFESFLHSNCTIDFKQFHSIFSKLLSGLDYLQSNGTAFDTIMPKNIIVNKEA